MKLTGLVIALKSLDFKYFFLYKTNSCNKVFNQLFYRKEK